MKRWRVAVIGAGVAGLTAAHELVERNFEVDVYDARPVAGGKSRSYPLRGTGAGGRVDLSAEHGYRFYPAFYRHVIDSMARIPQRLGRESGPCVAHRLVPCDQAAVAPADGRGLRPLLRRRPRGPAEIAAAWELWSRTVGATAADITRFASRMALFAGSCDARRLQELEHVTWWDFHGADQYSPGFQRYLRAVTRTMVAMDCTRASARTIGLIALQIFLDHLGDGSSVDRTLAGPTSDVWITPWVRHLKARGVRFHMGAAVTQLLFHAGAKRITGARIAGRSSAVQADAFVLAVPLEKAVRLATPSMAKRDEEMAKLLEIGRLGLADASKVDPGAFKMVDWMSGLQIFLREPVPLVRGHIFFPDSPWALSAISQDQFWSDEERGSFRDQYGDGSAGGVLSVDISDFNREGVFVKKPAKHCTPEEIWREVWGQLKAGVNGGGAKLLTDDLVVCSNLDEDIVFPADTPDRPFNRSPLLVHPPGSWFLRPKAQTAIENLVLAGDYVQTNTVLASMEGANEAARAAVNALLERAGSSAAPCRVWPLTEPSELRAAKRLDQWLFDHGLPGLGHL